MMTILMALSLSAAPGLPAIPQGEALICKRMDKTKPIAFNKPVCATKAQWKAYRTIVQKSERTNLSSSQAYAGVGSGY